MWYENGGTSGSFSGAARSRVAACGLKAYFAPMKIDLQLEKPLSSARVVVAMSGGVDSSVAAALFAASGADTIVVTLQPFDPVRSEESIVGKEGVSTCVSLGSPNN